MERTIAALPPDTARLIGSTQVITSVVNVVKELLENSLDAGSSCVDIKLGNFGLDKITVHDDGQGITACNLPLVCRPHCTSKLRDLSDLDSLISYGFRGEALAAMCSVADVSITTRTSCDEHAITCNFDQCGELVSRMASNQTCGTTVNICSLFRNVPVRRQTLSKKKTTVVKDCQQLLMTYGLIYNNVRLSLHADKTVVYTKPSLPTVSEALSAALGRTVYNQLQYVEQSDATLKMSVKLFVPRSTCNVTQVGRPNGDYLFIFINNRPVKMSSISKLVKTEFQKYFSTELFPVAYIHLTLPAHLMDVNLEPDKSRVLLQHSEEIMNYLQLVLQSVYPDKQQDQDFGVEGVNVQCLDSHSTINPVVNGQVTGVVEWAKGHLKNTNTEILNPVNVLLPNTKSVSKATPTSKLPKGKGREAKAKQSTNLSQCSSSDPKQGTMFNYTKRKKTQSSDNVPYEQSSDLPFSLTKLKRHFTSASKSFCVRLEQPKVLGPTQSGTLWVCQYESGLYLFQPVRAKEEFVYKKLLETHVLGTQLPVEPINLPALSQQQQQVLSRLEKSSSCTDPWVYITDTRLVSNGLQVRWLDPQQVQLTAVTSLIPFYGIKDLYEVLQLLTQFNTLENVRPLKVRLFLQAEAVRVSRSKSVFRAEVSDLFEQCISQELFQCTHKKPMLQQVYCLTQLSQTF